MADLLGIYGASGCGRGLMPLVGKRDAVFIDDARAGETVNGRRVLDWDAFLREDAASREVVLAVADPGIRRHLSEKVAEAGVELAAIRADTVVEMDDVEIGEGACLSPHVTLTSNIRIGRCFHANLNSYVEHDCVIGDFVTFAPRVSCNGNVHIGDGAYIGTGAVIRQGTPDNPMMIGEGAVVGMGAVVTKPVPSGATVVGNPARIMERG